MADVFLSYRKADRAKAEALANALKVENLDVWWDTALETGETFDEKIQSVLETVQGRHRHLVEGVGEDPTGSAPKAPSGASAASSSP